MDHEPQLIAANLEVARLRKLVDASKLINSSIEGVALYESILGLAKRELQVERGTLYFVDESKSEIWAKIDREGQLDEIRLPIGQGLAGTVAATGEGIILHDVYADPRFDRSADMRSGFTTKSMLCAAIHNRYGKIVGVLQLLNKQSGLFGTADLEFLTSISDHLAIAMENAMLHVSLMDKQRMQRELELGREIQRNLFPEPPSNLADLEITAECNPCNEVGGDYFDFIPLPDGKLGIAIGDVSGKGVAAALIMSSFQSALRASAPLEQNLAELGSHLNELLFPMTRGRKYLTLFFGRYDPATGSMTYINAGHNPPLLVTARGVEILDSTGIPIGMMARATYEVSTATLPEGATLLLYTDGFTEAMNSSNEEFGMERWMELAATQVTMTNDAIGANLREAVSKFEDGADPGDDKTLVVIRRKEVN